MFKKAFALLLVILTLFNIFCLSACSKAETYITKGEALAAITDAFGMDSYTNTEPYTSTVAPTDSFFPYVQTAFEWNLCRDAEINVNDYATKSFLAEALVNCVGWVDTEGMSSEELLEYAVEHDYVSIVYKGRTDGMRYVTREEVEESIEKSVDIWLNQHPIENREEITVADDVINLAPTLGEDDVFVDAAAGLIYLSADKTPEIKEGDTFIVPANNVDTTAAAYKAEQVEYDGDSIIIRTGEADLESTVKEMRFSGTSAPDFTKIPIIDGAGNVINRSAYRGIDSKESSGAYLSDLTHRQGNSGESVVPCSSQKFSFKVEDITVSGKLSSDGSVSFSLKGDVQITDRTKVSVEKSYALTGLSLDYDWDVGLSGLKYAYAKLNYTTVDTTGISLSWTGEGAFFADQRGNHGKDENGVSFWNPSLDTFLTSEVREAAAAKGAKTITLLTFPIVNGGLGRIDVDIKVKISVSGTVELTVTTHNANGFEYKNKNIRFIKEKKTDTDLVVKAKIEGTLYLGVTMKAVGINLVGAGFETGLGVEFKITVHLVNSDNIEIDKVSFAGGAEVTEAAITNLQNATYSEDGKTYTLHVDTCGDITTYFILRFKFDEDCALSKLLSGKTKVSGGTFNLEMEICGSKNAKIEKLCTHIEDWKFVPECTRQYGSDEEAETEAESGETGTGNGSENQNGDMLDLDTYYLNLLVGNTAQITVTDMPNSLNEKGVQFQSKDPSVATVDSRGKIRAVGEGTTEIIVTIPNTDYEVICSVTVSSVSNYQSEDTEDNGTVVL